MPTLAIKIAKEVIDQFEPKYIQDVAIMVFDDNAEVQVAMCGYEILAKVYSEVKKTEIEFEVKRFKEELKQRQKLYF